MGEPSACHTHTNQFLHHYCDVGVSGAAVSLGAPHFVSRLLSFPQFFFVFVLMNKSKLSGNCCPGSVHAASAVVCQLAVSVAIKAPSVTEKNPADWPGFIPAVRRQSRQRVFKMLVSDFGLKKSAV